MSTAAGQLVLNSPNFIVVSRDATAGVVTWIINGRMEKDAGLLTGPVAAPTANFHVSGIYHIHVAGVVWQIRGAVAAVVIQEAAPYDETIGDYLRAVYGVN